MTRIELITGFLGAGKTTFIARYAGWLRQKGIRAAIVENEFGRTDLDSTLLRRIAPASAGDAVLELTGGCICCGLKAGFHDLLRELCQSGDYDRIIVEPSGIFSLDDFFDVVNSPEVQACGAVGAVVTIVDPDVLETEDPLIREMLYAQMHSATLIVLSRLRESALVRGIRLREKIDTLFTDFGPPRKDAQRVITRPWEELDEAFFAALGQMEGRRHPHVRKVYDHAALFQSTRLALPPVFDSQGLKKALCAAFDPDCGKVLRMKGSVRLVSGETLLVNCTPDSIWIEKTDDIPYPQLNIIGRNLNRSKLKEILLPQ